MQVFTRQIRLLGGAEAAGWAMEVTGKAREASGLPISLWTGAVGLPVGSYAWSAPVEGLAQLSAGTEKMNADAALTALVAQGREFIADVQPDRLMQLVHGEIAGPAEVGSFMGSVSAVAVNGQGAAAGEWAVKIAETAKGVTGLPVVVLSTVSGPMFEFGWFVRYATAADFDTANAKIMGSESYAAEVASGSGLFQPGATQVVAQRIA
ncbi:MAG: hypothetical protein ACR2O6_06275 [Ilumatobacteraceae bacterium]